MTAQSELPTAELPQDARLSVYVHWPFCVSKCPYCDFNSHVATEDVDHHRWQRALLRELAHFAAATAGRTVTTVFFGGGTPSLMDPATVAALLAAIRRHWAVAADVEVTLEANPSSAEAGRFAVLRDAGVNRLSIGVQSLDDDVLRFLGRAHSAGEARGALAAAARAFPRYSFDLIYGWAGHTASRWRCDLDEAVALAGDHLSAYQLTIERGTAFHRRRVTTAGDDVTADLYQLSNEFLGAAGFPAYEISNHARPGGECQHNLSVWQGGDYLGIGPGAHGRISDPRVTRALQQHAAPQRWLAAVESHGHGTAVDTPLTTGERREELILMGLRLRDGVERSRFRSLTGMDPEQAVDSAARRHLAELGLVTVDDYGIRLTPPGCLLLDTVAAALLAPEGGRGRVAGG